MAGVGQCASLKVRNVAGVGQCGSLKVTKAGGVRRCVRTVSARPPSNSGHSFLCMSRAALIAHFWTSTKAYVRRTVWTVHLEYFFSHMLSHDHMSSHSYCTPPLPIRQIMSDILWDFSAQGLLGGSVFSASPINSNPSKDSKLGSEGPGGGAFTGSPTFGGAFTGRPTFGGAFTNLIGAIASGGAPLEDEAAISP